MFFSGTEWSTWIDGEERRARRSGRKIDIDLQFKIFNALSLALFKEIDMKVWRSLYFWID